MMSAFSRGFYNRPDNLKLIKRSTLRILKSFSHQHQSTKFFGAQTKKIGNARRDNSTPNRLKNRSSIATEQESSKGSKGRRSPVAPSTTTPSYQNYATTLVQKSHSTLLFTGPSSLAYFISSYTSATFCFSYGILSYWNNYLCAPPDIAVWIPYAFSGVSFAMVLFGIRFLRNPLRMVKHITAFPKSVNAKPTLDIKIEIKRTFPLPFRQPRIITVAPHEIIIPTPVFRPINSRLTQSELRRQRAEEALRHQQELEYERSHVMSAGLRHMGRALSKACTSIFRAVQRSFTRENFLEMRIRGKIYKLDLDGGWLLDNGKAIDRLVTLEPYAHSGLLTRLTRQ